MYGNFIPSEKEVKNFISVPKFRWLRNAPPFIKTQLSYILSSVSKFLCLLFFVHCSRIFISFTFYLKGIFLPLWRCGPTRTTAASFLRFLDHKQWRTTFGRTPLDEWLARLRDLCLKAHNAHNKHPKPRRDSNPHPQQASHRRPMP